MSTLYKRVGYNRKPDPRPVYIPNTGKPSRAEILASHEAAGTMHRSAYKPILVSDGPGWGEQGKPDFKEMGNRN
jgi:hypothetical protein